MTQRRRCQLRLSPAVPPHPVTGGALRRLPAERQSGHLSSHGEPRRRRDLRHAHRQRHPLRRAQRRVHRVPGDQRDRLRARRPLADHLRRRIRLLGAVQADRVAAGTALDAPADLHRLAGQTARRTRRQRQRQRLRWRRLRRRQRHPRPGRVIPHAAVQRPHLRPIARLRLQAQPAEVEPSARRRALLHHPAALPQPHVVNQHARTQPLPLQPQPARRHPAHPHRARTQTGDCAARIRGLSIAVQRLHPDLVDPRGRKITEPPGALVRWSRALLVSRRSDHRSIDRAARADIDDLSLVIRGAVRLGPAHQHRVRAAGRSRPGIEPDRSLGRRRCGFRAGRRALRTRRALRQRLHREAIDRVRLQPVNRYRWVIGLPRSVAVTIGRTVAHAVRLGANFRPGQVDRAGADPTRLAVGKRRRLERQRACHIELERRRSRPADPVPHRDRQLRGTIGRRAAIAVLPTAAGTRLGVRRAVLVGVRVWPTPTGDLEIGNRSLPGNTVARCS